MNQRNSLLFVVIATLLLIGCGLMRLLVAYPSEPDPTPLPGSITPSATWTDTPTNTAVSTPTLAPTIAPSATPTISPTATRTLEPTQTPTVTGTAVLAPTETATALPNPYQAKYGDSLWSIAVMFCGDGRKWTITWRLNPGIRNPQIWAPRLITWGCG